MRDFVLRCGVAFLVTQVKKMHKARDNTRSDGVNPRQISAPLYDISFVGSGDNDSGTSAKVAIIPHQQDQVVARGRRHVNLAAKRLIDIAVSSTALVVLSPALLSLMVMIRLESRGWPIFTQARWGRNMSTFRVYKFRTMFVDKCDPGGVDQTQVGDPRVTRLGAILRRTNIDELPQLINVLKGDMSLVGPRCHPIGMRAGGVAYEELVGSYHRRHEMRPGMTGLAQANGYRGPTTDASFAVRRIQFDLQYIRHFSVWLDMKIMFATLVNEIRGGGTGS